MTDAFRIAMLEIDGRHCDCCCGNPKGMKRLVRRMARARLKRELAR